MIFALHVSGLFHYGESSFVCVFNRKLCVFLWHQSRMCRFPTFKVFVHYSLWQLFRTHSLLKRLRRTLWLMIELVPFFHHKINTYQPFWWVISCYNFRYRVISLILKLVFSGKWAFGDIVMRRKKNCTVRFFRCTYLMRAATKISIQNKVVRGWVYSWLSTQVLYWSYINIKLASMGEKTMPMFKCIHALIWCNPCAYSRFHCVRFLKLWLHKRIA